MSYLCANFGLCSRLRPDVRDRQTYVRRQTKASLNAPCIRGGGITICVGSRHNMPLCKLAFNLLTLKVVSESRVTWVTSMPILVFHYMMTSFTLLHFAWNRANHCGGTCSQFMSQVGGGKTGNRLRWSIPL